MMGRNALLIVIVMEQCRSISQIYKASALYISLNFMGFSRKFFFEDLTFLFKMKLLMAFSRHLKVYSQFNQDFDRI